MQLRVIIAFGLAVGLLLVGRDLDAQTSTENALKQAQEAFDQAQVDYLQGKYDEAADKFKQAHAARAFPQFLYNVGAAYHMKGKKTSDPAAYEQAINYYKKYLADDPQAADKVKIEKTITVLEAELKRLKEKPASPSAPTAPPSAEVQGLGDVKVRGLVVIESEPTGAYIYLDDRKKGAIAQTPWSGSLEGEHLVIIEKRGHKVSESRIAADPSKLFVLRAVMSEQSNLGWVEITSNVPGAAVFADNKNVGSIGPTPFRGNFPPGKHKFWVTAEGYDEVEKEIDVIAGENHNINIELRGSPVGYVYVRGAGIEDSAIYADGKLLCERGPCRKGLGEGTHQITVRRPGYKTYSRDVQITPRTETSIKVGLARRPGRTDAIVAYAIAGVFVGGAIFCGVQSNGIKSELEDEINAGMPPPDADDPRFLRGKIYAIAADSALALGVIAGLTGVYYTFREKGPPSTALIDVNSMSVAPSVAPGYAGLNMEVTW